NFTESDSGATISLFHSSLVGAGDAHVFPIFCDGAAGNLNALRLQDACNLLVGQRAVWIFFLNKLFYPAFEDQQRGVATLRTIHALAEEVAQLENALRSVGGFVGDGTAHSGRMNADFFG